MSDYAVGCFLVWPCCLTSRYCCMFYMLIKCSFFVTVHVKPNSLSEGYIVHTQCSIVNYIAAIQLLGFGTNLLLVIWSSQTHRGYSDVSFKSLNIISQPIQLLSFLWQMLCMWLCKFDIAFGKSKHKQE